MDALMVGNFQLSLAEFAYFLLQPFPVHICKPADFFNGFPAPVTDSLH